MRGLGGSPPGGGRRPRLGQHFLADVALARRIVAAAGLRAGEDVVEIGPGGGALTGPLLETGARVTAVEIDSRLAGGLKRRFEGRGLRLLRADFLSLRPADLPVRPRFVANLPYAAASAILDRILSWPGWAGAVLMFQREVAERLLAAPGSRDYGLLTVATRLRARVRHVLDVGRRSFRPPPRVDSGVVALDPGPAEELAPETAGGALPGALPERLLAAARAAFAHRRKTAANSIALSLNIPRAEAARALQRAGLPQEARAEDIAVAGFARLSRELGSAI